MSSLQPNLVAGSSIGLRQDIKPYLMPEQAFSKLENAYVWRERVVKKQGFDFVGRLRRLFEHNSIGNSGASPWSFNIYSTIVPAITPEATAEIAAGSVIVTLQAGPDINISDSIRAGTVSNVTQALPGEVTTGSAHNLSTGDRIVFAAVGGMTELNGNTYQITVTGSTTFTLDLIDTSLFTAYTAGGTWQTLTARGNGFMGRLTPGNSGTINYLTGDVTITTTAPAGTVSTIVVGYYPGLPVMGIWQREQAGINDEQTIFWDTKYVSELS